MKTLFTPLFLWIAALNGAAHYEIDWFALGGGGGHSSGGAYTLNGTLGQSATGLSEGGPYTLQGGFWSAFGVVQTDQGPVLRLILAWPKVVLSWPGAAEGFQLQETLSLASPNWTDVQDVPSMVKGEKHVSQEVAPGTRFYRLRKP